VLSLRQIIINIANNLLLGNCLDIDLFIGYFSANGLIGALLIEFVIQSKPETL